MLPAAKKIIFLMKKSSLKNYFLLDQVGNTIILLEQIYPIYLHLAISQNTRLLFPAPPQKDFVM